MQCFQKNQFCCNLNDARIKKIYTNFTDQEMSRKTLKGARIKITDARNIYQWGVVLLHGTWHGIQNENKLIITSF